MRRLWLAILLLGAAQEPERDRSPGALVLSPDGRWALTANRSSDSVSLVDLKERKVAAEVAVGLAIIVALYRARQTTHVEDISTLKF